MQKLAQHGFVILLRGLLHAAPVSYCHLLAIYLAVILLLYFAIQLFALQVPVVTRACPMRIYRVFI
jgi:hypothetical protein